MPKVSVILVLFSAKKFVKPVFDSIFAQTHKDLEVIAVINGNADGAKELVAQNYPQVKILDPGQNLWFSNGNNLGITHSTGEYIFLVNQDVILEPDYVEKSLFGFKDEKIAAVTGKLLRYDFEKNEKLNVIDTTGIIISNSGRAKDRGQLEIDQGQYDNLKEVFAISGACVMYKKIALDKIKYSDEYFDGSFKMYWEDVDLSWRLNNAGYKCLFVPEAVAYHGRTAGQSKGGYLHLWHFIRHHNALSPLVRKFNYKNHILMYLKNTKQISLSFILREFFMFFYVLVFETGTLAIIPELFRSMKENKLKRLKSLNP